MFGEVSAKHKEQVKEKNEYRAIRNKVREKNNWKARAEQKAKDREPKRVAYELKKAEQARLEEEAKNALDQPVEVTNVA